jgi:hypothetical protein
VTACFLLGGLLLAVSCDDANGLAHVDPAPDAGVEAGAVDGNPLDTGLGPPADVVGALGSLVDATSAPGPDFDAANVGLFCCDGTRSPTCLCGASLRGCCSSHGGVCDCGR